MGCAEVISLPEVRARKQWDALRQQLHERFDQWLDTLETQWPEPPVTFTEVTATVWGLRQQLTGSIAETIVAHVHHGEHDRKTSHCPKCDRVLQAREPVRRTVDTLIGSIQLTRPYFYCRTCHVGHYPFDDAVGVVAGRTQVDIHKAAAHVVTEVPYDTAQALFHDRSVAPSGDGPGH